MSCRVCKHVADVRSVVCFSGTPSPSTAFFVFPCGDGYCRTCFANFARSSLQAHQQIPLQCCQHRVPREWIENVLASPEALYYLFLESQNRTDRPMTDAVTAVATTAVETLHANAKQAEALPPVAAAAAPTATTVKPSKSMIVIDLDDDDDDRPSVAPLPLLHQTEDRHPRRLELDDASDEEKAAHPLVIDITDDATDVAFVRSSAAPPRRPCFTCSKQELQTADAACGHSFCYKCITTRCRQAVTNDEDDGIAFPLRCCNALLPIDVVRSALSRQLLLRYTALVAKREGDFELLTKRKRASTSAGKSKAKATAAAKRQRTIHALPPPLTPAVSTTTAATASECVACLDQISADATQFKGMCGHVYCSDCIALMAKKSLEDRSLVPIRCCSKELPAEYVARVLTKRDMAAYTRFVKEKQHDWKNSTLKSDKEYAKLVASVGGKQCPTCGIGVQRVSGCDHMKCLKGHKFCWKCGLELCMCDHRLAPPRMPPMPRMPTLAFLHSLLEQPIGSLNAPPSLFVPRSPLYGTPPSALYPPPPPPRNSRYPPP